jgi:hypothetical protein
MSWQLVGELRVEPLSFRVILEKRSRGEEVRTEKKMR